MKRKGILIFLIGFLACLWALPWISGYLTSLYFDLNKSPLNVNGLTLSFSNIEARHVNFKYGTRDVDIEDVSMTIKPWRWLIHGLTIETLAIKKVTVSKNVNTSSQEYRNQSFNQIIPVRRGLIDEIIIDDQNLGKMESLWEKRGIYGRKLTFIFHKFQKSSIYLESHDIRLDEINYKINLLGQTSTGKVNYKKGVFNWFIDGFEGVYPHGLNIKQKNDTWLVLDPDHPKEALGNISVENGYLSLVNLNFDLSTKYSKERWFLKLKSRHFEIDMASEKKLEGIVKLNQYPFMDRLVTGLIFINKKNHSLKLKSQLNIFNYQSKDKLKFELSSDKKDFSSKLDYFFEDGDFVKVDAKSLKDKTYLARQSGKINKTPFNAQQKVRDLGSNFQIEWQPLVYGKYKWQNNQKTDVFLSGDGIIIAPDCFTNKQRGQICFKLDFGSAQRKGSFEIDYLTKEKTSFSEWLPRPFIIADLAFKGSINLKYNFDAKYPIFDLDAKDISFKLEPLIATEIPLSSHTNVTRGAGKLHFESGSWQYKGSLYTDEGGQASFDSSKSKNIQWSNLLSGYASDSYLVTNGYGVWKQNNNTCHFNVFFQKGRINVSDYYPKISNPVKVNFFNIPIIFSFHLKNDNPIELNILGIEGFVNIDLSIEEKESVWIADGSIAMLPGGIFRRNIEPVLVREAKLNFYSNDILDPFIQMSFEKKQTLLTRQNQISNYKDELLGVRFYGKLKDYQIQTYSIPSGISEFVILQSVLINPIIFSSQTKNGQSDLLSSLASSIRDIRVLLPVDQITFRPAERKETLIDPYEESSSVSMMKRISNAIGLYARIGSLPQDNIFSVIYRQPNRKVGTQLYSNYESQGINFVFSR